MLTASTPKLDLIETWQDGDPEHRVHVQFPINTHTGSGDERGRLSAGDLAVIPAMVPHGVRNVGEERLKVVGFFSEAKIISEFSEPLQPVGAAVLEMGAEPPAAVEVA